MPDRNTSFFALTSMALVGAFGSAALGELRRFPSASSISYALGRSEIPVRSGIGGEVDHLSLGVVPLTPGGMAVGSPDDRVGGGPGNEGSCMPSH